MRYTNEFDKNENNQDTVDIYSYYEDVSSSSRGGKRGKRRKKKKSKLLKAAIIILVVAFIAIGAFWVYALSLLNKVEKAPLEVKEPGELNISTNEYAGVKNIALLGIDTRSDNTSGRSDAVLVLSIDKKKDKIKLISIARDSYVKIDGHGQDKLTHAYAFGKSTLAVKTLNKNFGLEITDYVTVNFFEFSRMIDYIGGVELDLTKKEVNHINSYIIPRLKKTGLKCKKITKSGKQRLDGVQALCYARIRKIDGDIERGNRQKNVLEAMFKQVKKMNVTKLPKVVEMVLSECQTSLSNNDIMSMGLWAMASDPVIEDLSIPNKNIKARGQIIRGGWYYVYDTDVAKQEMKNFILELEPKTEEKE
ncbi:MAG: LytR family transcriptional regulator [Ruminococcaceae bacterium]|nr:LytR family transcriptional regulator [Oscillospiraceae bacterium]